MNILQVTERDLTGRRFNGFDLQLMLNSKGHNVKQIVFKKESNDDNVSVIGTESIRAVCNRIAVLEEQLSLQNELFPMGRILEKEKVFIDADIIHYHLIHSMIFSLPSLAQATHKKPSVWTLHDPWVFTGHCVHPFQCTKWETGCFNCENLDIIKPLRTDTAHYLWKKKKDIYKTLDIDVVVASNWMKRFLQKSPLIKHLERVHVIPFGIDTDLFNENRSPKKAKNNFKINEDAIVIFFRSALHWKAKGTQYIIEALKKLESRYDITILTCGDKNKLTVLNDKFKIVELGWSNNEELMAEAFAACDIFLMPSLAESFGLMAIEAMASGKPVICFHGTALPDITFAPDCGIAVETDSDELRRAILYLLDNPQERIRRGKLGVELAKKYYNLERYENKIVSLYNELMH